MRVAPAASSTSRLVPVSDTPSVPACSNTNVSAVMATPRIVIVAPASDTRA
jgi:hypothetical protein